ncbi:hypothetical protein CLNEO_22100 [Anaerotignum neopropionicum]|uniref:Uncharacterized protein n=1 Tax=Anaerotignum neopropionicum TaxID=36847 RepID=A0A136WD62_9FIRM|nr:permease prefix domain 1-containing protein [Anaerotignum neopropionicum]KXL52279.1 hypothetical protein CLNEO_22100 [Anaerotignum neopropionicum]
MRVPDWEEYLKQILSHVKFKYDHNHIYFELKNHMEDRYDEFVSEGMEEEQARETVLACMGDADEIGEELNKAHSPFLGWIWRVLKDALILLVILNFLPALSLITSGFISVFESYDEKSDSLLVYSIDVGYREKIYDTTVIIDKILYYEDHTLEVRYATWTNPFSDSIKWSSSIGVTIYDEQGKIQANGNGWKSGSYYGRGQKYCENIPLDATKAVISYGIENEIPIDLKEGRVMANES